MNIFSNNCFTLSNSVHENKFKKLPLHFRSFLLYFAFSSEEEMQTKETYKNCESTTFNILWKLCIVNFPKKLHQICCFKYALQFTSFERIDLHCFVFKKLITVYLAYFCCFKYHAFFFLAVFIYLFRLYIYLFISNFWSKIFCYFLILQNFFFLYAF